LPRPLVSWEHYTLQQCDKSCQSISTCKIGPRECQEPSPNDIIQRKGDCNNETETCTHSTMTMITHSITQPPLSHALLNQSYSTSLLPRYYSQKQQLNVGLQIHTYTAELHTYSKIVLEQNLFIVFSPRLFIHNRQPNLHLMIECSW
jgi:hypothetical protein